MEAHEKVPEKGDERLRPLLLTASIRTKKEETKKRGNTVFNGRCRGRAAVKDGIGKRSRREQVRNRAERSTKLKGKILGEIKRWGDNYFFEGVENPEGRHGQVKSKVRGGREKGGRTHGKKTLTEGHKKPLVLSLFCKNITYTGGKWSGGGRKGGGESGKHSQLGGGTGTAGKKTHGTKRGKRGGEAAEGIPKKKKKKKLDILKALRKTSGGGGGGGGKEINAKLGGKMGC